MFVLRGKLSAPALDLKTNAFENTTNSIPRDFTQVTAYTWVFYSTSCAG